MKKLISLFVTIVPLCLHLMAQTGIIRDGSVIDTATMKSKNITYTKTERTENSIYSTTYQINSEKKQKIQEVQFLVDKLQQLISIVVTDQSTLRYPVTFYNYQKYEDGYSLYIMKNYNFNDTLIEDAAIYRMLFTIPDTSEPYVQLNSFLGDSSKKQYKLYPLRDSYIKKHKEACMDYFKMMAKAKIAEEPKPKLDTAGILQLKSTMIGQVFSFVDSLKSAFLSQVSIIKKPDSYSSKQFELQINNLIDKHINSLKCSNGGLSSIINVQIDTSGKVSTSSTGEKLVRDSVNSKKTIEYRRLFKKVFLTEINALKFPVSRTLLTAEPYSHKLYDYIPSCKILDSSIVVFAETFAICRTKLHELDSIQVNSPTLYSYKFSYRSSDSNAKWKLSYKGRVTKTAPNAGLPISSELRAQFFEKIHKKRAGRYFIHMCDFEYNGNEKVREIDSVKLRYKYYTNIGVSIGTFIPVGLSSSFTFNALELMGIDFFVTYHHIGFFAGSALYNNSYRPNLTSKTNTVALSGKPLYLQTGLFLGTCNYLYLKAGVSFLNTDRTFVDQYGVGTNSYSNTYLGFTGGVALIFPIVHIEGGFNTVFMAPYASLGFNIPLKR